MPAKTTQSGLLKKYGGRIDAAVRKYADADINYGFQRLPGGITNGVARLVECTFGQVEPGKTNAGEVYFRAAGVVVEPYSVMTPTGEVVVRGQQTSIFRMVCDTKDKDGNVTATHEDNVEWIMNEMKKLGAEFDPSQGVEQMETLAVALKEQGPYFRFRTSESKATPQFPNPRVWENWDGTRGLEEYVPPEDSGVSDDTEAEPAPRPSKNGTAPTRTAATNTWNRVSEPAEAVYSDSEDIDSLLERANADDGDAQGRLVELAVAAGHTEEAARATDTWEDLVELVNSPPDASGDDADSEASPVAPVKGDVYPHRVSSYDPKTKKTVVAKKPVDCEILTVDPKTQTITLKNLVTGKPVLGPDGKAAKVGWDKLETGS